MINVTKHPIRFQSTVGEVYELPPNGVIIDARFEEELVSEQNGVQLVRAKIVPAPGAEELLRMLEVASEGKEIIVGSLIAAQAFPGRIVALVAVAGFERVAPSEKRM